MTALKPPPIYQPIVEDAENPVPSVPWILFFNQIYNGDTGTQWTPNFVNLTKVGSPVITGTYYKVTSQLCFFSVTITPNGGNTTATTGTTYIDNFPMSMTNNGACFTVSGLVGTNAGMVELATQRVYPVGWTTVNVPLTIVGMVEAR